MYGLAYPMYMNLFCHNICHIESCFSNFQGDGGQKKLGRLEDFADLGAGYDETDPFIDNTDAVSPFLISSGVLVDMSRGPGQRSLTCRAVLALYCCHFYVKYFNLLIFKFKSKHDIAHIDKNCSYWGIPIRSKLNPYFL